MCNKTSSSPRMGTQESAASSHSDDGRLGGFFFFKFPERQKLTDRDMEREKHEMVGELNYARILCVCETCVSCTMR